MEPPNKPKIASDAPKQTSWHGGPPRHIHVVLVLIFYVVVRHRNGLGVVSRHVKNVLL